MTSAHPDSPIERRRRELEQEEARRFEEQKQRDIETFRSEIEARRRNEQRSHILIQKLHALKWAAPVAVAAWSAGLMLFMLAARQPFSMAAAYSAASFGFIGFLLTYLLVLDKRLEGELRPERRMGTWVWYFLAVLALSVAWIADRQASQQPAATTAVEPPVEATAEIPLTGIGQVRMPQPPPRKEEPPKEVRAAKVRMAAPAPDKGLGSEKPTGPKLPCVIKSVMTDEEIQRCRDS